jgi:hypothetical protein
MSNIALRPHYFLHDYIASFLPPLLCLVLLMYACIQFYFFGMSFMNVHMCMLRFLCNPSILTKVLSIVI